MDNLIEVRNYLASAAKNAMAHANELRQRGNAILTESDQRQRDGEALSAAAQAIDAYTGPSSPEIATGRYPASAMEAVEGTIGAGFQDKRSVGVDLKQQFAEPIAPWDRNVNVAPLPSRIR